MSAGVSSDLAFWPREAQGELVPSYLESAEWDNYHMACHMGILPGGASSEMDAKDSRVRIGGPIGGESVGTWDMGAGRTRGGDQRSVAVQRPPAVAVGPELNHQRPVAIGWPEQMHRTK